jgi:hypothetical protein
VPGVPAYMRALKVSVSAGVASRKSSATVRLTQKGLYRFTTKAGEDYAWAGSMKTAGEDNVLHLTVRVK